MKRLLVLIFLLSIFLFHSQIVYASLFINEFSSGTSSDDWVELYNSGSDAVDLSLYILRDSTNSDSNKKDLSGTVPSGGFVTVDYSNKLNNGGDIIRLLLKSDESGIDQVGYGDAGSEAPMPDAAHTSGRTPDGSLNFAVLSTASKGGSNNAASVVPTATMTPTAAPTPTKTPTPTPTSKPSSTPTPQKTPTSIPTATHAPTQAVIPTLTKFIATPTSHTFPTKSAVLGVKTEKTLSDTPTSSPVLVKGESTSNFPSPVFFVLIGLGIITCACGILLFREWKKQREEEI